MHFRRLAIDSQYKKNTYIPVGLLEPRLKRLSISNIITYGYTFVNIVKVPIF